MNKIIELLKKKLDIKTNQHGRAVLESYPQHQIETFELEMIDAELELLREQQRIACTPFIIQPNPQDVEELEKALRDDLNRKYPLMKVDFPPKDIADDIRSWAEPQKPLETRDDIEDITIEKIKDISNPYQGVLRGSRLAPPIPIEESKCKVCPGCVRTERHDDYCLDINGKVMRML